MDDAMWTRRSFLAASAASAASVRAAGAKIRLGGPIYLKSADPRELAREHRRLGYSAAYCPDAKADDTARIRAIEAAFAAEDVVIAEVGAWKNIVGSRSRGAESESHLHRFTLCAR